MYGFASGLGVAAADATYAGVAAFGLTAITSVLVSGHWLLGIIGGSIIVVVGIRTIRSRPAGPAADAERPGLAGGFLSIYALTMTNPLTIVLYAGCSPGSGSPPARASSTQPSSRWQRGWDPRRGGSSVLDRGLGARPRLDHGARVGNRIPGAALVVLGSRRSSR
jgi:hypothetical protein